MATTTKTKTATATHTEMAQRYISRHWSDIMFTRGAWYLYQGGVWNEQHDLTQEHEFWNLLEEFGSRCRPTLSACRSVTARARARLFVPEEEVDCNPNLINLTNGVYHLADGNLYPHDPGYHMTTQLPFDYDPDAKADMWDLYTFSTFVQPRSTKHDPELVSFIREAVGYSLTTSVEHHVSFWCHGEGANGKGVLFHVLEELAGNAAIPLNVGLLRGRGDNYQLADLAGKRVALCSEADATDSLVKDSLIKALISGDALHARQVYSRGFTLQPMAKLWWAMNKLPSVADTSYGFWRRMRVIPFNRQFKEKERILDLKEQLALELPGIFCWAMEGLKQLRERGHFSTPTQVKQATERYEKESNPVALFIEEECIIGTGNRIQSSTIYSAYKDWCRDSGYKALSTQRFKTEMERLKYFHKKTMTANFFEHVALKYGP